MRTVDKCNILTLKILRKRLGLKQTDLAGILQVRQKTVSDWETGKCKPSLSIPQIKAVERLLKEAGLSFQDLPDDLSTVYAQK